MSFTFSLVCRETKRRIWIGQGYGLMSSLYYGDPKIMERLRRFLNAHKCKPLEFVCDDQSDFINGEGWEEFEETDPDDEAGA